MVGFHSEEFLEPRPAPKLKRPPLFGCLQLLILCIRSYPPYWRQFLHPQPEGVPFRGDRDRLIKDQQCQRV